MKLQILLAFVLSAAAAFAAEPASGPGVLFNAILTSGKSQLFAVSTVGGGRTAWLPLGSEFQGYKLKSFSEADQCLILERDGKEEKVRLATASIKEVETKATLADAQAVIEKMRFEELIAKTVESQKKGMLGMMRTQAPGRQMTPEHEAFQAKIMDVMMSALDPVEMKKDMARIYAEVFTKDELKALSDFYGTPAGQSFIAKQPDAQAKMQEAVMPRMMAVMPKIRQMGAEFAEQQRQKKAAAAEGAVEGAAPKPPVAPEAPKAP